MIPPKVKDYFDLIVSISSIVSCVTAVYGVFQVVEFVVDIKPIVVPIAKEVKEGNVDVRKILSGTTIRHDTVRVIERDTIYLKKDDARNTGNETFHQQMVTSHRLTEEEERHLDKSADKVSEQERQEIDEAENSFRKRMRENMK